MCGFTGKTGMSVVRCLKLLKHNRKNKHLVSRPEPLCHFVHVVCGYSSVNVSATETAAKRAT